MLVLSRKLGERIQIAGGTIEVVVLDIGCGKVRLGVKAPKEVPVHRQEVFEAIHAGTRPAEDKNAGAQPVADGSPRKRYHRARPSRKS